MAEADKPGLYIFISSISILSVIAIFIYCFQCMEKDTGKFRPTVIERESRTESDGESDVKSDEILKYEDMDFLKGGYYRGRFSDNVLIDGNIQDVSGYVGTGYDYYNLNYVGHKERVYRGSDEFALIESFMSDNIVDYPCDEDYYLSRWELSYRPYSDVEKESDLELNPGSLGRICMAGGRYNPNLAYSHYLPEEAAGKFVDNYNEFAGMDFDYIKYMAITDSEIEDYYKSTSYNGVQRNIIKNALLRYGRLYYAECGMSMNGIRASGRLYRLGMVISEKGVISAYAKSGNPCAEYVSGGEWDFSDKAVEKSVKNCVSEMEKISIGEVVIRDVAVCYDERKVSEDGKSAYIVCPMIVVTVYYADNREAVPAGKRNLHRYYDIRTGEYIREQADTWVSAGTRILEDYASFEMRVSSESPGFSEQIIRNGSDGAVIDITEGLDSIEQPRPSVIMYASIYDETGNVALTDEVMIKQPGSYNLEYKSGDVGDYVMVRFRVDRYSRYNIVNIRGDVKP